MLSKSDTKINFLMTFHTTHRARQSREVGRGSGIIVRVQSGVEASARVMEQGHSICTT